jgi:glycerol uptake facilitator-like aquaporin
MPKTKAVVDASSLKRAFSNELLLGALVAELIGTFVLTLAILNTGGNAIVAALAVLILVLVLARLSGGHVNPVVTIAMLVTRQITPVKAAGYLVTQFLGAMLAVVAASQFLAGSTDPYGQPAQLFSVTVLGDWKPFFAEMVGAIIFGFGVASAVLGKKEGFESAFTIGGALLVGLIIATSGSQALLNPAVALGVGALDTKNLWGFWAYALAPVLGGAVGALLYKLLQSDITLGLKRK